MTHRVKWASISIVIYVIFVACAIGFNLLNPAKIGISWTIFWYVAAAGLMYYFYFKNMAYQEVIYYARQLKLSKTDLEAMVPDRKNTAEVPDPDHPNILTPLIQVPLSVTNVLTDVLEKRAKDAGIAAFK